MNERSERRDGPRIDLRLRVRYSVDELSGEAEASDVSPRGMRFETAVEVPAGGIVRWSAEGCPGKANLVLQDVEGKALRSGSEPEARVDPAAVAGTEPGALEGPGLPDGTGEGDDGNAAEGLNQLQPPAPRGMIIPPRNRDLRGTEVQVWVFVDERGRVVPDSTRLDPPTRDRGFNRRLMEEAAEWIFRPALQAGQPVASWFPYTIFM